MTNLVTEEVKKERKQTGRRGKRFKAPKPAIPVKALWQSATEQDRQRAHETGMVMMEYWLGRISKVQAAKQLEIPPIRVWQLSQKAISGMLAGLLIQPKTKEAMMNPSDDPILLKKRITELEEKVKTLEALVQILKQMPGIYEERKNEKAHGGAKGDHRRVAKKGSGKRKAKNPRREPSGKPEDAE